MNQQTNLSKFASQISSSYNDLNFTIPFKNGNHSFKIMSVAQHQKLLATDNTSYKSMKEFRQILFNIMKENSLNGIETLSDIDQADFYLFLYWNRYHSLSKIYNDKEMVFNDKFIKFEENLTITFNKFTLTCSLPTIEKILWIESQSRLSDEDKGKFIVDLYRSEIIKYIDIISVEDDYVTMKGATYEERIKLLDVLPAQLVSLLSEKLTKYSQYISENFVIIDGDTKTQIPLNVDFYNI